MHIPARLQSIVAGALFVAALGCAGRTPAVATAPSPDRIAPDSFSVSVETSRGPVLMMMHRAWAPHGIDRFYSLVRQRYYDSVAVFRVVPKFVVQFGLAANPKVTARYRNLTIPDDPVRQSNLRGAVSFARGGVSSRTAQLFINLVDNVRLDTLNGFGFPPIGRVVTGMALVDSFNAEYSAVRMNQDSIARQGNPYVARMYPRLDYILRMKIVREWNGH